MPFSSSSSPRPRSDVEPESVTITNSEVQSEVPSSNETSSPDTSYSQNTSKPFAIPEKTHPRRQVIESDNYFSNNVDSDVGGLLSKREVLIITVTTISAVILIVIAAVVIIIKVS